MSCFESFPKPPPQALSAKDEKKEKVVAIDDVNDFENSLRCRSLLSFFAEHQKAMANISLNDKESGKQVFGDITQVQCVPVVDSKNANITMTNSSGEKVTKFVDSLLTGGTKTTKMYKSSNSSWNSNDGWDRSSSQRYESCISLIARIHDKDLPFEWDMSRTIPFTLDKRNHQTFMLCAKKEE